MCVQVKSRGWLKLKRDTQVTQIIYIYIQGSPSGCVFKWNLGGDASWKGTRRKHSSSHSLFMLGETWSQNQQERTSCWLLLLILASNICYLFVAFVSEAFFGLKKTSNWLVSLTKKDCGECKPASKIDCRGVVHIFRVLFSVGRISCR